MLNTSFFNANLYDFDRNSTIDIVNEKIRDCGTTDQNTTKGTAEKKEGRKRQEKEEQPLRYFIAIRLCCSDDVSSSTVDVVVVLCSRKDIQLPICYRSYRQKATLLLLLHEQRR